MNTSTTIAKSMGVRKGSWTEEEDFLLRKCIQNYGEGKWNLVPIRAGLNRCRKSCRLRWLNYLRPHIKRGDFAEDEIDLIFRLHNLLGNRRSLIAGRLSGRTANDVKNYWNTHLQRKLITNPHQQERKYNNAPKINKNTILSPRPRNISSSATNVDKDELRNKEIVLNICEKSTHETTPSLSNADDDRVEWWTSLLENCNEIEEETATDEENKLLESLFHDDINSPTMQQVQNDDWDEFSADIEYLWNLLN